MTYRQIIQLFVPIMTKHAFVQKKKYFYLKRNDILFGIAFDKPSKSIYCTFFLIPLWIPMSEIYYTYGNRINDLARGRVEPLFIESSEEQVQAWVNRVAETLESVVFPFFEKVRTPSKLLEYIQREPCRLRNFMFCSTDKIYTLRIYLLMYLKKYDDAGNEVINAKEQLSLIRHYTDEVKSEILKELQGLEGLLRAGDENNIHMLFCEAISCNCRMLSI